MWSAASLSIRVLGPIEVSTDNGLLRLTSRERSVLAVLTAGAGRLVPTERIIDATWTVAPPSVRNRVHSVISGLRRRLGRGVIVTRPTGYALCIETPAQLDAAEFEWLTDRARTLSAMGDSRGSAHCFATALRLWRGAAYEDVDSAAVTGEAARLRELRCAALDEYATVQLERGALAELIDELTRALAEDPLQERLRGHLMVALHRCGRQAEALAVYDAGARLLAEELGLDPSGQLKALRGAILADEPIGIAPAATVERALPRQLPASVPNLAGRRTELAHLHRLLLPAAVAHAHRVVVVTGMPGIGKSALALFAAQELQERYPDGCLYADLHSRTSPATALAGFLDALGWDAGSLGDDVHQRAALFRSATYGRRMLVVLDGAEAEDHVRPLLPAGGNTALITSRHSLSGLEGSTRMTLDVLPEPDCAELLGGIAGYERIRDSQADALAVGRLCGGVPLAVRIAALRLARHPAMAVSNLAERLRDPAGRLAELIAGDLDIGARLRSAWQALPPATVDILCGCSTAGLRRFTADEAAGLAGSTVPQARRRLDDLVDVHLLDCPDGTNYGLHELVALSAAPQPAAPQPDASPIRQDQVYCTDLGPRSVQ
jgi:DNA-binding SARP family transcriptional activator